MRAMDCDCGEHLEAATDEAMFEKARRHVDQNHPEMELTDEQVQGLISEKSYSAEGGQNIDQRGPSGA